jgi:hypothetical protein
VYWVPFDRRTEKLSIVASALEKTNVVDTVFVVAEEQLCAVEGKFAGLDLVLVTHKHFRTIAAHAWPTICCRIFDKRRAITNALFQVRWSSLISQPVPINTPAAEEYVLSPRPQPPARRCLLLSAMTGAWVPAPWRSSARVGKGLTKSSNQLFGQHRAPSEQERDAKLRLWSLRVMPSCEADGFCIDSNLLS